MWQGFDMYGLIYLVVSKIFYSLYSAPGVTYATMGTVCASSLLGCLVDLDVLDDEGGGVEAFGVCIGFGVAEKTEKELGGLDGPASFGDTELFA
jgi:hypothetical protein